MAVPRYPPAHRRTCSSRVDARAHHPDLRAGATRKRGVPVLEAVTFGVFSEVQRGDVGGRRRRARRAGATTSRCAACAAENEALQAAAGRRCRSSCRSSARSPSAPRSCRSCSTCSEHATLPTTRRRGHRRRRRARTSARITIDKGTATASQADMAVIAPAGVVGRVVGRRRRTRRKVQLLIDRNAAAGALIERTRAQGVVVGVGRRSAAARWSYVSEPGRRRSPATSS